MSTRTPRGSMARSPAPAGWRSDRLYSSGPARPRRIERRKRLKILSFVGCCFAGLILGLPAEGQAQGTARPDLVFSQIVSGMPRGENQTVRVLTASFKPGDKTVTHTHRSPVTVYILEGAF